MSTDIVLLFPGQGSQKAGMAKDLADAFPAARQVLDEVDQALSVAISRLMFEGPEEELTSTQNAQPALLAHSAALWAVLRHELAPRVRAAAGHSLGEFTAYHAAGAFTVADAARVVRRRGELMHETGVEHPGAMAAILGLAKDKVEEACRTDAKGGVVVPANYNSPDQLVISGDVEAVERAMVAAKGLGAKRAIRLRVSGAFHSPLMAAATDGLREALDGVSFGTMRFPVYSNVTARPSEDADDARRLLLEQLGSPVQWTELMRNLAADHPGALFVELGPGSVLTNLAKKIAPGVQAVACGTAAEVEQLRARLAAPADAPTS